MGERVHGLMRGARFLKRRGVLAGVAALAAGALHQAHTEVAHAAPMAGDSNTVSVAGVTGTNTLAANNATGVFGTTTGTTQGTVGVWGRSDSTSGLAKGVFGENRATTGSTVGVWGQVRSTDTSAAGVFGQAIGGAGQTYGVLGTTFSGSVNASGVKGIVEGTATNGVWGQNNGTELNCTGVFGLASQSSGITVGVWGRSQSTAGGAIGTLGEITAPTGTGTGVKGSAAQGVGVIGTSTGNIGVYGASSFNVGVFGDAANNTAVMGRTGAGIGVYGTATNPGGGGRAAVFDGTVLVNGPFTVVGGPKSAGVKHLDGSYRRMYCQESPEPWFEDFGTAHLVNGRAEVTLDPEFDAVVKGDDYLVFPVPEGDCNGLYISRKGPHRFVVEELKGGKSSIPFSYRLVSRRREEVGKRLERVDVRKAPEPPTLPVPLDRDGRPVGPSRPHIAPDEGTRPR